MEKDILVAGYEIRQQIVKKGHNLHDPTCRLVNV